MGIFLERREKLSKIDVVESSNLGKAIVEDTYEETKNYYTDDLNNVEPFHFERSIVTCLFIEKEVFLFDTEIPFLIGFVQRSFFF